MPNVSLTRRVVFSAAHRLHSAELSDEENLRTFGKCNHPNGHGHNYILEVTVRGEIDPKTGMVINLTDLMREIDGAVLMKMDHKNLNVDLPEFAHMNTTAENIAVVIWRMLEKQLPKGMLEQIRLHETENNSVTYRGE